MLDFVRYNGKQLWTSVR